MSTLQILGLCGAAMNFAYPPHLRQPTAHTIFTEKGGKYERNENKKTEEK